MNSKYSEIRGEMLIGLLADLYNRYGYDFADYSEASLLRRINQFMIKSRISSVPALMAALEDKFTFNTFLEDITVNVTEMFRDPLFFRFLREKILPELSGLPHLRIWHAGCSTGEEVYSMLILLKEAGLLEKSLVYATDINRHVLDVTASGTYSLDFMEQYNANYIEAGGKHELSKYFLVADNRMIASAELKKKIVISPHNLVTDESFNEFHLVLCRNVLIYFNANLQNRVLKLFSNSLVTGGYLALGTKETIGYSALTTEFSRPDIKQKVWEKLNKTKTD